MALSGIIDVFREISEFDVSVSDIDSLFIDKECSTLLLANELNVWPFRVFIHGRRKRPTMSSTYIGDRTRPLSALALAFFIKSQRRVIAHCEKLLAADGLRRINGRACWRCGIR